jgi:hypothetical protein
MAMVSSADEVGSSLLPALHIREKQDANQGKTLILTFGQRRPAEIHRLILAS